MKTISIKGKTFKQIQSTKYYCDDEGNIYSEYSHKILKWLERGKANKKYPYVDINFGDGQKHCYIHKLVYETWIGDIPESFSVLHKDDNQFNNNINNLYLGNQKENIEDCKKNNHRVGNTWILTVYDKEKKETLTFCPANKFIEYSGHPSANGSINRFFTRQWFIKRYEIIDYYQCKNLDIKNGVTTKGDECSPVEQNLSLLEVRGI